MTGPAAGTSRAVSGGMRGFASLGLVGLIAASGCILDTAPTPEPLPDPNGLPACASPKAETIFKAVRSYIPKGSVTDQNFVTSNNKADEPLYLDGPQIF